MFRLKRPCSNCPFVKGAGLKFQLGEDRVREIVDSPAFQCHKTVDYDQFDDPVRRQGEHPQQCVGLMGMLLKEGKPNQITQVAIRLKALDPEKLELDDVYGSLADAIGEHS